MIEPFISILKYFLYKTFVIHLMTIIPYWQSLHYYFIQQNESNLSLILLVKILFN